MYCSDCGYKFEDYDPNECRLCGSTRKSYSISEPTEVYPEPTEVSPEPTGYSRESSGSGKKKYVIIPVVLVGIIFAISMAPEMSLPEFPDIFEDDGIYQISISEIPSFADKRTVEIGISKAMMMWEDRNTELEFELTDERGEIRIAWEKYMGEEHAGLITGGSMELELGSYDCKGNWQQYSSNTIADNMAHELGHYIGLEHHTNKSHLMYGDDEFTQIEFDDLGYNIPGPHSQFVNWIAYEKLEPRYDQLKKQYDQFPQTIHDPGQYNRAMQIYNELNKITAEMKCIADQ